jgi:hypothetical protein
VEGPDIFDGMGQLTTGLKLRGLADPEFGKREKDPPSYAESSPLRELVSIGPSRGDGIDCEHVLEGLRW